MLGTASVAAAGGAFGFLAGPDYEAEAAKLWRARDAARFEGLVHYATLAANSHNAQPWRFRKTSEGVAILPDLSRALPVADGDNHHLYASLGCAAENLMLAAGAAGRSASLAFAEEGQGSVNVALGNSGTADPLFEAILERQCTRSVYDGRAVPAAELEALAAAGRDGAEVMLIDDRARMEAVLELILAANDAQVSNPAFAAELESWLRFNARAAVSAGDGLYSGASGNPSLPGFLGRFMFRRFFTPERERDRYARQVRSSAGLAIIHSAGDGPAHWVNAGRAYQRFALRATMRGIRHAHLNQPVEVATVRPALQSLLGLGGRRPDMVLRFGYGPAMPRSLRRPVADVIAG